MIEAKVIIKLVASSNLMPTKKITTKNIELNNAKQSKK